MSGIFARWKSAVEARLNEAVDLFEDPRSSLDYSLVRLEEKKCAVSRSLVEVSATRQRLDTQRNLLSNQLNKYGDQASTAVAANREDLARIALERKHDAQTRINEVGQNLDSLDQQIDSLKQSQINLAHKISTFKAKKEELKSMYDASRAQLQVREALSGVSKDLTDVGSTIRRIEERIQTMRARAQAIDSLITEGVLTDPLELGTDDIDRQLSQIRRSQVIDDELTKLKAGGNPAQL